MRTVDLVGSTPDERNQWLKDLLKQHVCDVTFTKVNGEIRIMPCTLIEALLPPQPFHVTNTDNPVDFPAVKKQKKTVPEVLSVWCLDKLEWRSFKVMNVTQVSVTVSESKINPVTVDTDIVQIGTNSWSVSLQEDTDTGDMIMPLPDMLMQSQGWNIGDTLTWDMKENGSVILTKKD